MSGESPALIQLGVVGAPFGVRGWIKLRSHTDPPERLLDHRSLRIGRGSVWRDYRVEARGRSGGALTVKLVGVEDRNQAQVLRGAEVCVPRSELPPRDGKDFYRADLIGCEVVNLEGLGLGVVEHFIETPVQVLMVVRGAQEFWIPAVPQHLRRVDLRERRVVVDWSAAASGA
jgi:16S rRNA processing protein RimM